MRVTPVVGRKAWFGPRRFGWGWAPVSWEGWAAVAAFSAASAVLKGRRQRPWLLGAAFLALCAVKGTTPGGRRRRAEYRAAVAAGAGA